MRDKYIEEIYPRYFILGEYKDGRVDVVSVNKEIAAVTKKEANVLISDRDEIVLKLCDMAKAFDKANHEEFTKFWYGK